MPHELSVRLCQLVQHYPELYDSLNERFHDDEAKNSAWRKVAWCLEVPQSECDEIKIKWKKIRHQFVKAKKERNTSWDLWPYLQFLSEAEARSIPEKSPPPKKKLSLQLQTHHGFSKKWFLESMQAIQELQDHHPND